MEFLKKNLLVFFLMYGLLGHSQNSELKITDYYPLADGNEWRYTAPKTWKDGDYISRIAKDSTNFKRFFERRYEHPDTLNQTFPELKGVQSFLHFDATGAAKMLQINEEGLYYVGELFADGKSFVLFDRPILWFLETLQLSSRDMADTSFSRYFNTGEVSRGSFTLEQNLSGLETIQVPAGTFADCIKVSFTNSWDFGGGTWARSENVYHHAPNVGVVKASARFIVGQSCKVMVNRLVEPDLKKYTVR